MRKILMIAVLLGLMMATTANVSAVTKEGFEATLTDISYDPVEVLEQQRIGKDKLGLRVEAIGSGTFNCNNQTCLDSGLDGATIKIWQGFMIAIHIDHTSAGIKGRTTVSLTEHMYPGAWETVGNVKGAVTNCENGVCDVAMKVSSNKEKNAGLEMDLTGKISVDPDTREVSLYDLAGGGILRFR
jgi:hypothetical protein